jgi:replicative DNA helicase
MVVKQRNGPTGNLTVTFLRQFLRFEDFLQQEQAPPF